MSSTRRREEKQRFLEALELGREERASFLERLRAEDESLWTRVASLLAADEEAARVEAAVERATAGAPAAAGADEPPRSLGDYELLEEIATGGMGVVYRARQISLGRTVALKLLRTGELATEREVQRFRAEAETVARLDHPRIVPIYDIGSEAGRHFFSMKLIDGPSLDACIERYAGDHGRIARLVVEVARAVHHGHQRGVLHRDLKPSNILLDAAGAPFVADFGTAKLLEERADGTRSAWICGTPAYMAPEQASSPTEVTIATDVYSLGCVLYELLTGVPPFEGRALIEILRRVQEEEPLAPRARRSDVPRDLDTITTKCLQKDPSRRYESALALAQDLERWLAAEPIRARPATLVERALLVWRRKPMVAGLAAAVAVLVCLLAVGGTYAAFELKAHLERAQDAEEEALAQLRASLLAQARAGRRGVQAGRRAQGLELLGRAAEIRPGADLRAEAAACLALTDIEVEHAWPRRPAEEIYVGFDRSLERYARGLADGSVEVRRVADDALVARLPGAGVEAWLVVFGPGSRHVAVKHHTSRGGQRDRPRFVVWELEPPRRVLDLEVVVNGGAVAFSPDGAYLATGHHDEERRAARLPGGRIVLRELASGRVLWDVAVREQPSRLAFDPQGARLAVASYEEGPVDLLDARSGAPAGEVGEHEDIVYDLEWSADGAWLATACADFRAYLWPVAEVGPPMVLRGHLAEVVRVSLGGELVATHSWDETTRLWDRRTGELLLVAATTGQALSRDGTRLACVDQGRAGVWRVRHGDHFRSLVGHRGKSPWTVDLSSDGRLAASGGTDGVVLWEVAGGRALDTLDVPAGTVHFVDGDRSLYTCGAQGLARWPLRGDRIARDGVEVVLDEPCKGADLTPDGRIAVVRVGADLRVLALDDPEQVTSIRHPSAPTWPAISPDGTLVAEGNWKGEGARVWRVGSAEPPVVLLPGVTNIEVGFSPDGARLVTCAPSEYALWRTDSFELERAIPRPDAHTKLAGCAAFDASGERLAIDLTGLVVRVLEVATGQELWTLEAPDPRNFTALRFDAAGERLFVASETNRVQVWELARLAREVAGRGL